MYSQTYLQKSKIVRLIKNTYNNKQRSQVFNRKVFYTYKDKRNNDSSLNRCSKILRSSKLDLGFKLMFIPTQLSRNT